METRQREKQDDPPLPATGKPIRRRARDVSSRYMATPSSLSAPSTPIHPSSTSSSLQYRRLPSPKPRIRSLPSSPDCSDSESEHSSHYANENQRSFETPLHLGVHCKAPNTLKRGLVRLFSDNNRDISQTQIIERPGCTTDSRLSNLKPRPGTPRSSISHQNQLKSTKKAATREEKSKALPPFYSSKGLMARNSTILDDSGTGSCSNSNMGGLCHSPPIRAPGNCKSQASELRSSMPEADALPTCVRRHTEAVSLPFRRSLNSAFSNGQPNPLNLMMEVNKMSLADEPMSSRSQLELKKGKKGLIRKEDAHNLGLLHNQYLQWMFVKAKEKIANESRAIIAKRSLNDVSERLKLFRDSVMEKRTELEKLKRMRILLDIIDSVMPHLEEWALAEGEYSVSLSGTIKALQNASIKVPLVGDVRVDDVGELQDAIQLVTRTFESLSSSLGRFLPLVEEDKDINVVTELAKVVSREKALIEECGRLSSQVQKLQIQECSLRSVLMQAKR